MGALHPPVPQRPRLLPASRAGRWALALFVTGLAAFGFVAVAASTAPRVGETFSDDWWLAVPALAAGVGAVGAAVVGAYAVLRRHDHAASVYLTTAAGLVVLAFVVGETFTWH